MNDQLSFFKEFRQITLLLIGAFAFALAIASCNQGPPEGSRVSQAQKGKIHFMQYCQQCHGEDGTGLRIDSLDRQPADLTAIMRGRRSNEFPILEIANIIDGRKLSKFHADRDMPIWGDVFTKNEYMKESEIKGKLAEIIAYIMSIQQ